MKYYTEEITVLKDGTSAQAITEVNSQKAAVSAFHLILASAGANPDVQTCHAEAKNSIGGVYKQDTYVNDDAEN